MSGVQTIAVAEGEGEQRLDRWFKRHFPDLSHVALQKLLRSGQIRVDGKRAESSTRITPGQIIRVPPLPAPRAEGDRPPPRPPRIRDSDVAELMARILYKDEHVIALDKPAGLAVQGGSGQERHLDALLPALAFDGAPPVLVHRLDKDTSGVQLLARTPEAARFLTSAFRTRDVHKTYWAITVGVPIPAQGRIDAPLSKLPGRLGERITVDEEDGKRAVTLYRVADKVQKMAAFMLLRPLTGRTHQLRVHMLTLGTPILGDGKYAGPGAFLPGAELPRQLHLLSRHITCPHPAGGTIDVTAPVPDHMQASFDYLGLDPATAGRGDPFPV